MSKRLKNPIDQASTAFAMLLSRFASHRHTNEFKTISLVIDSSTADRPTLIIHVDGEDAGSVADRIEKFCTEHGAYTQREHHSKTDIRVLATVE